MFERTRQLTRAYSAAILLAVGFGVFAQLFAAQAAATVPHQLNYQARVTNPSGVPVGDGALAIQISIYDAATGGNCLYTMRGTFGGGSCTPATFSATTTGGTFTVQIGDTTQNAIPESVFANTTTYLGITIGADAEMTPRKPFAASAYAFNADRLDTLDTSNAGGSDAYVPVTDSSGNLTITGNVGVGTTALASTKLTVRDTLASPTNNIFQIANSNDSLRYLTVSSTTTIINTANLAFPGTTAVSLNNVANALNFDSNTLTIDALNNRVGIGTTTPLYALEVSNGAAYSHMGLVAQGVGYGNPVAGPAISDGDKIIFYNGAANKSAMGWSAANTFYVQSTVSAGSNVFDIYSGGASLTNILSVKDNGNLGIGSTTPSARLVVADTSSAASNLIQATNANDSVRYLTVSSTSTVIGSASTTYTINTQGTRITGNLTPSADNTYSLGDPALRWKDLWLSGGTANVAYDTSGTTTLTLGRDTTTTPKFKINANGLPLLLRAGNTGGLSLATNGDTTVSGNLTITGTCTGCGGGSAAGSTGAVQFNSSGSFTADSTNFFWDNTNKRLGIGTASPITQLNVSVKLPSAVSQTVSLGSAPAAMDMQGRFLYVVDSSDNTMNIYDVSNSSTPELIYSFTTLGSPLNITVKDQYAYISESSPSGVEVVDISNPSVPVSKGMFGSTTPFDVAVQGQYAYVANAGGASFDVYDLTSSAGAGRIGTVSTLGNNVDRIVVEGRYAYVSTYGASGDKFRIYDLVNPASPSLLSTIAATSTSQIYPIDVQGRYAYVLQSNVLRIIDVKNPASPSIVSTISTNGTGQNVTVQGRYAYVLTSSKIMAFDVSNPASPSLAASLPVTTGVDMSVLGRFAYTIDNGSLNIYDIGGSYLQQLEAGGIETGDLTVRNDLYAMQGTFLGGLNIGQSLKVSGGIASTSLSVAAKMPSAASGSISTGGTAGSTYTDRTFVQGNYAYVTNGASNTLQIFDITVPTSPTLVSSTSATTTPMSVYVQGRYAYVVNYSPPRLTIIDVKDPGAPSVVKRFAITDNPERVYVQGGYAYVLGDSDLMVIDIRDVTNPIEIATYVIGGTPGYSGLFIQGNQALVTSSVDNAIISIDISDPYNPTNVGSTSTGSAPGDVYAQGRYAYVTNNLDNTLQVFDVKLTGGPLTVGTPVATGGGPTGVFVQGKTVYVATDLALEAYDITDPANPAFVGSSPVTIPIGLFVQGRYAYVQNFTGKTLKIFDLGGGYIQQLEAGGLQAATLSVRNNLSAVDGDFRGGLTVGQSMTVNGILNVAHCNGCLPQGTGTNSFAFGQDSFANLSVSAGASSYSFDGGQTGSSAPDAFAFGSNSSNTLRSTANGASSFAFDGGVTGSAANDSFAFGTDDGYNASTVNSPWSYAFGGGSIGAGHLNNFAFGQGGNANRSTVNGDYSYALGGGIIGSGALNSFALGSDWGTFNSESNGTASYAFGGGLATGNHSYAFGTSGTGNQSTSVGTASYAFGGANASGDNSMAFGSDGAGNWSTTGNTGSFAFGGGTSNSANAFTFGNVVDPGANTFTFGFSNTPYVTITSTGTTLAGTTLVDLNNQSSYAVCHTNQTTGTAEELMDCDPTADADYKEMYPSLSDVMIGDIVALAVDSTTTTDGDRVSKLAKTSLAYQSSLLGVVSDAAKSTDFNTVGYNIHEEDHPVPLALNGRVKVNVTGENGSIHPGDPITSSSTGGFGMKATSAGRIVGLALADFNPADVSTTGTVMVFVNPTWFNGPSAVAGATTPTPLTVAPDSILDFQNSIITGLKAVLSKSGKWSITDDGFLSATHIDANEVSTEKLTIKTAGEAQTAGTGTILATYNAVLVQNPSLHENSMIVVTFNGNPGSSWWISEKHEGSFMLSLAAGAPTDISFTWWAVGVDGNVTGSGTSTPPTDSGTSTPPTPPPTDSGSSTPPTDSGTSTSGT